MPWGGTLRVQAAAGALVRFSIQEDQAKETSGWRDSHPRPRAPHARALLGCATP